MGAGARKAVARPRLGVDPFTSPNRPQWLVEVLAQRQAEQQLRAQQAISRMYRQQQGLI
ncbi:protein of unknown function [Cupriavidus taiwanensis]|nr:protein of unknown function [Cupriavidus taiwanensis]